MVRLAHFDRAHGSGGGTPAVTQFRAITRDALCKENDGGENRRTSPTCSGKYSAQSDATYPASRKPVRRQR